MNYPYRYDNPPLQKFFKKLNCYDSRYFNFCSYDRIPLYLEKCVKAGLEVKMVTVKKRLGIDFAPWFCSLCKVPGFTLRIR